MIIKNIAKSIFGIFVTLFIMNILYIVMTGVKVSSVVDIQVIVYLFCSILTICLTWFLSFFKFKTKYKLISILILLGIWILLTNSLPAIKHQVGNDICVDSGICD